MDGFQYSFGSPGTRRSSEVLKRRNKNLILSRGIFKLFESIQMHPLPVAAAIAAAVTVNRFSGFLAVIRVGGEPSARRKRKAAGGAAK